MKNILLTCLIISGVLCWASQSILASGPVADAPVFKVGDTWSYGGGGMKKVVEANESIVTVLEKAPDKPGASLCGELSPVKEMISERDRNYTLLRAKTPDGKIIPECGAGEKWLDFPLSIGKTWSFSSERETTHGGTVKAHIDQFQDKFTVEAFEEVTVPAGTFKAFKIKDYQENRKCSAPPNPRWTWTGTRYFWYAPDAKRPVKATEFNSPDKNAYTLKSFKFK